MEGYTPVKVAILDTGIREEQKSNIAGYFDFVSKEFVEGTPAEDLTGHGTDMVHLLRKTCPFAEIYVARVFKKNNGDINTAEHVAKAILHARKMWKVHIISMSFGFKNEEPKLVKVIRETNDILMFAASSNFGAKEDRRFPARVYDRVMCINAADGRGYPFRYNPPEDQSNRDRNFSILGVAVPLSEKLAQPRFGTGTSMATPIAAGVAALVLEFAWQKGIHEMVQNSDELRSQVGMVSVFRKMAVRKDGYNFISPGSILLPDGKSDMERMSIVCRKITKALNKKY
jgi:hypothetical protein